MNEKTEKNVVVFFLSKKQLPGPESLRYPAQENDCLKTFS